MALPQYAQSCFSSSQQNKLEINSSQRISKAVLKLIDTDSIPKGVLRNMFLVCDSQLSQVEAKVISGSSCGQFLEALIGYILSEAQH